MTEPPVDKWRHPVAAVQTLSATAFVEKVIEQGLRVEKVGPYLYAAQKTDDGYDMFRAFSGDWGAVKISTAATADPAAGAQVAAVTVPAGKRYRLLGFYAQLVCDANVANRYFQMLIKRNGTAITFVSESATAQGATITLAYHAGFIGMYVAAVKLGWPPEGIELPAGAVIQANVLNLQAGDNITALQYDYKEVDDP